MTQPQPAGWYDDPTGQADLRWWDGAAWTTQTDARAPVTGRGAPAVVWWIVAGLVLVAVSAGAAAILLGASDDPPAVAGDTPAPTTSQQGDPAATDADEPDDDPAPDPAADPPPDDAPPDTDADDGADGEGDGESELAPADESIVIDFDGVCEVEIDPARAASGDLRAWNEGCDTAPVPLGSDESRWIVVVSSLNGDDFTFDDALDRASVVGLPGSVLWSSHYPSLNPDLWVVYAGPFDSEDRADEVAGTRSDGSYARVLSDDDSDRYCVAADGCLGERG